jgi:hypothetical protein
MRISERQSKAVRQCALAMLLLRATAGFSVAADHDLIKEIVIKNDDGFIALRNVQPFGSGVPLFKAKAP